MKVVVIGGGVVGITTAYYAARDGHEVTVFDRMSGPARETSFANAGEISPGYATPWASPDVPAKALKWLFMEHAPLILRLQSIDPAMVAWGLAMLRNCTPERYAANKAKMVRLATYSRDMLRALRTEEGIEYDQRSQGTLQIFRTQKQYETAARDMEVLQASGIDFELLDREGCCRAEPGLANAAELVSGGLRLPGDETGDCFKFTDALTKIAKARGVSFHWNTEVDALSEDKGVVSAQIGSQTIKADAFVLAGGSWSPRLAHQVGIRLPIYPVKGYSITLPIIDEINAPQSTLLDETFKVATTRLGNRVRVGGMAELAGFDRSLNPKRQRTLERSVFSLFPSLAETQERNFWCGHRPMTPDSVPFVCHSKHRNLWLNTGHGTLGWTMACGSARMIADKISGRQPETNIT
ncbi:D-amino acid dehydrogenase [Hyphomonas pacifica]|uniref:D-amino acid dehydrogenase small subunit n=1 Tax=Hyphomonas pacifica TaxID=1280941 RepID=A0A062U1C3_9PROT|nr:D-amino acid dehydrogenase [Hyphomonas pacifica]KCZ49268.1 D-amino acid dehydrogenase small subunit [Hyphomonas pacifica]RAN31905.1 D-amino acid dehydrogenase small subunit [Hyphomonas pacifica]